MTGLWIMEANLEENSGHMKGGKKLCPKMLFRLIIFDLWHLSTVIEKIICLINSIHLLKK